VCTGHRHQVPAALPVAAITMHTLNVKQYCCIGLNFGCFYDRSPVIV
jgi:hypothetical protein